jgi:hypothetical protein
MDAAMDAGVDASSAILGVMVVNFRELDVSSHSRQLNQKSDVRFECKEKKKEEKGTAAMALFTGLLVFV